MATERCSFCGRASGVRVFFVAPDGTTGICEACVSACWSLLVAHHPRLVAELRRTEPTPAVRVQGDGMTPPTADGVQ